MLTYIIHRFSWLLPIEGQPMPFHEFAALIGERVSTGEAALAVAFLLTEEGTIRRTCGRVEVVRLYEVRRPSVSLAA